MNLEKYSCYEFEIVKKYGYTYKIFGTIWGPYDHGIIESDNFYDTEQEARFAAIGHITLLENGEG